MSRRLALMTAVPLATLAVGGTAAAAPAPPQATAPPPSTAEGITLCHEGFEINLTPVRDAAPDNTRAVVVLIGANDYGLVAGPAC